MVGRWQELWHSHVQLAQVDSEPNDGNRYTAPSHQQNHRRIKWCYKYGFSSYIILLCMGKVMISSLEGEQKYLRIQPFCAFKSKIQRTWNSYFLKPTRVIWACWQLHFLLHCGEWTLRKRLLESLNSVPAGAGQMLSQCQSKGSGCSCLTTVAAAD